MFQQRIQLQREEPRSRWSIPCCSSFRTRGIQLPEDDSDHEEEEEQNIAPFHIESTHFLQHPANLSRNPFARVDEQPEPPKIVLPSQEEQLIEVTEQESSRQKYENEPDWTELHQAASAAADAASDDDDDDKSDEQSLQEETIVTVTEEEIPKKQEKIPQIEREVLHLLPLPQLSNELPPTMIHKKPSFEKSMYGEQPLMSTTSRSNNTSRFSRFSMTEQDFLALKKQETDAATATATATVSAAVTATATASVSAASTVTTPISIETPTETPIMTDPLQATHVRKSSIVSNAAQSILGDKLDDFTEKLAFIKKNIIMNQDSDDEEADNAEETLRKIALLKQDPSTTTVSR
ncbi:uncharacterized protein EV154DRAFT_509831 [Mucor mucedo]|uniref:uncharacterized protein n=1 Tax=Mucor mucedo TaxID=29922 RepID=UPI002220B550|nr:uncharacterized protein EV154DRAFT_509831 [Mucor mucedo]KAI7890881.1 hypothetical protein EV154DRAFT_509831 [Mucor mucedo]